MCAETTNPAPARPASPERHRDLIIDEGVRGWRAPTSVSPEAASFRRELGLPDDRAVVMTGHQPVFWHPGILAKYFAADAVAARETDAGRPAVAAWCVPDHAAEDPGTVAFPRHLHGRWVRGETNLFGETGDLPEGLAQARDRLLAAGGGSHAARQIAAQRALLGERLGLASPAPAVLATEKHTTDAFGSLIEAMARDPLACVRAYNDAARAHPDSGVRPLVVDERTPGNTELPLWAVSGSGTLIGVRAGDLASTPASDLRPKALLFTGLLRALGCDLFIHGTGGGAYDLVTEEWLGSWMGWTLAPIGVVTATLTLDLGIPDVTRADLRDARWRAHHARHHPSMLGSGEGARAAAARKRELVGAIAGASDTGERAALFAEMHRLLDRVRDEHAEAIAAFDREAARVADALASREIARDRSWAWVLHDDRDLLALRDAVVRTIRGNGS